MSLTMRPHLASVSASTIPEGLPHLTACGCWLFVGFDEFLEGSIILRRVLVISPSTGQPAASDVGGYPTEGTWRASSLMATGGPEDGFY